MSPENASFDKVWVLAEASADGKLTSITGELLTKAREVGTTVEAVVWGEGAEGFAADLGKFGATKVYNVGDLGGSLPGVPVASAIAAQIAAGNKPDAILFPQSYDGRDIAGRLSAKLNLGVLTNLVGLDAEGSSEHAIFGGATIVKAKLTTETPYLFVVRAKSFAPEESGGAKIKQKHVEERTGPKLDEAAVVVSGGRGLGEAKNFEMVEELAKLLKGAPGASRAIVDAGWVPYAYQVGQTGKTVKPTIYLALGISGATQHMVGMKGAKNIIAINKDEEAPILSIADLGIVGDVHKVVPKLIEALKAR